MLPQHMVFSTAVYRFIMLGDRGVCAGSPALLLVPSTLRPWLAPCTNEANEEVNFRNALLLRFVFLLVEVGLINKCHLSYKQKLLGTEEYE